ncbi:hypothetical protein FSZ31_07660 [Sphingorhabdus soli]|uniref:Uncharacterized protein n=1 Tax=Flavisphingopyxis soli TaxID=2601267 RepID=A0A5C6UAB9_9SPHN|nr:hypothetical protein [Sphingorhabdus soli]TXC68836.1 hypothetical protein FSZ31_07660 [Sphingorhabdus soli]
MKYFVLAALPLAALVACNVTPADSEPRESVANADQPVQSDAPLAAQPAAQEPIRLRPLTAADLAANPLDGELGCSFVATGGAGALLVASGVVEVGTRINGIVKPGDRVARVDATGDFAQLERGLMLIGDGIEVTLSRGGKRAIASEATHYDATLRVARSDGERHSYAGSWTCGP